MKDQQSLEAALGRHIAQIRSLKGWTQEQLADKADIHWRTIQKIEGGEQNPSYQILYKIRRAFNCSWDELLLK